MPKKLAIVGYGKMGRLIEELAPEAGFSIGLKLDIDTNVNQQGITPENFRGVDVAIEFSTPHTAVANVERLCANPIALRVKLADLENNLDTRRLSEVSPRDAVRLSKYLKTYRKLQAVAAAQAEAGS